MSKRLVGVEAHLAQAGQVLGRGVQDPLGALEGLLQRGQRGHRDRVDEPGAGALAAQLDQVGAVGVAVARGALGVDGHRPGRRRERGARLEQALVGVDHLGEAVAQLEQRRRAEPRGSGSGGSGRVPARRRLGLGLGCPGCRASAQVPRCPRRLGMAVTPSGTGGRPTAVHISSPHASTCGGHVEAAVLVDVGRPRRPDLDLGGAGLVGHPAEALGGDARDRAGRGVVAGAVGLERLGQPRPADRGQHRVGAELGVDVGAGVGHAAEGAVPRVVAGGVVQQDQPAGAEVLVVDGDVAAERRRPRRDALRRGHLLAEDLRAQRGLTHRLHSRAELRGPSRGSTARVGLVTGHHSSRVGQRPRSPMCRHAA